jgi:NAD(P)-dependent dehydrogenase (short-subunit alcohol dehydrogenase family)
LGGEQADSLFYFVFRREVLMEAGFTEKVVLVTGATSGIGHAVAVKFAEASARVAALGRNQEALTEVENAVKSAGGQALTLTVDVTKGDETRRAIDEAINRFGRLDVLVNAAGHISSGSIETTSLAAWDAMMDVNLRSVFQLMQLATPHLIETKGNIVNVSSVTGLRSFPGVLAYCVSKAALDQLTRCAALELAPKGVRVNAVNPGVVVTEIHKRGGMSEADYEKFLEHSKTTHPLGRVGDPKEIAELIFYLASEKASWITGATYQIDGGRALTCAR